MVARSPQQDAFLRRLQAQLEPAMQRVGELVEARIRRSIGRGKSRRNGAPARETGELLAGLSTSTEVKDGVVETKIVSSAPYSLHLELGTRHAPAHAFMRPELWTTRKRLATMLAAQLKRRLS